MKIKNILFVLFIVSLCLLFCSCDIELIEIDESGVPISSSENTVENDSFSQNQASEDSNTAVLPSESENESETTIDTIDTSWRTKTVISSESPIIFDTGTSLNTAVPVESSFESFVPDIPVNTDNSTTVSDVDDSMFSTSASETSVSDNQSSVFSAPSVISVPISSLITYNLKNEGILDFGQTKECKCTISAVAKDYLLVKPEQNMEEYALCSNGIKVYCKNARGYDIGSKISFKYNGKINLYSGSNYDPSTQADSIIIL